MAGVIAGVGEEEDGERGAGEEEAIAGVEEVALFLSSFQKVLSRCSIPPSTEAILLMSDLLDNDFCIFLLSLIFSSFLPSIFDLEPRLRGW